jgi:hypothetical protein
VYSLGQFVWASLSDTPHPASPAKRGGQAVALAVAFHFGMVRSTGTRVDRRWSSQVNLNQGESERHWVLFQSFSVFVDS